MMTDWQGGEFDYSADTDPLNAKGVLAALRGHSTFAGKLRAQTSKAGEGAGRRAQ